MNQEPKNDKKVIFSLISIAFFTLLLMAFGKIAVSLALSPY
jgi:hypothetical protein